jgi:hypothetical protein
MGDNKNMIASWMEDDDDDDDDNNVLLESLEGGGLKPLDAALNAEEERKPSSSPPDFDNMSADNDNDAGWFDAQGGSLDGSFDFTPPSSPTSTSTPTQQPSSAAQHTIEQASNNSMDDPLYNLDLETISDINSKDASGESLDIFMLEFPTKEPEHKKTITFANIIATPFGAQAGFSVSETSFESLDIFKDESFYKPPSSKHSMGNSSDDMGDESNDDDSFDSAIDEDDEDKQIRRQILYAAGGMGVMAFMGFAGKKLLKMFGSTANDTQDVGGGMDMTNVVDQAANVNDLATAMAGDGGSSYASAASTSQSSISTAGGFGMNPGGGAGQAGNALSAAQSQVMQTMAVNAASNAATSAATAASGLATVASAAAAAAAGTAVATAAATVSTIATVVRSSQYDETFGALVMEVLLTSLFPLLLTM